MWIHNLDPTIISFGIFQIRWYGLVYVLGFLLSVAWLFYLRKKKKLTLSKEEIWDFTFYLMLGLIIGARLFMAIWRPEVYLYNPINLLKFWEGGMSFHGGFVGIVVAGWIYCKKKKLNFWRMADFLSIPAMLILALGRVANFINGELVGRITNAKWCVLFSQHDSYCRHPSTIYGAGKRFLLFFWLMWLSLKDQFKAGFIFWNFVLWESVGRLIVDFFREDKLTFGLSLGQWFSVIMIIVAIYVFYRYYPKEWKKLIKP
jgi:phosphatidylglycerol---prolipoprotein diacylglyceryl transferase